MFNCCLFIHRKQSWLIIISQTRLLREITYWMPVTSFPSLLFSVSFFLKVDVSFYPSESLHFHFAKKNNNNVKLGLNDRLDIKFQALCLAARIMKSPDG